MLDIYEATGVMYACLECLDGEGAYDVAIEVVAEVEYEHESYDCPSSIQYKIVDYTVYYEGSGERVTPAVLSDCAFTLYQDTSLGYVRKSYATVEELLDRAAGEIDWE